MLIRALRAENFMRFSRLRIENLPQDGIIGIEGPNESGKTTIGDVLLFALFGKTRLVTEAPVLSLIRWGADSMSVEVEFTLRSRGGASPRGTEDGPPVDGDFLIYRQVDRYGTNYVKIVDLPERRDIASGHVRVSEFLARHVGFDAEEFQQSFYHDQYEVRRVETGQVAFFESATGLRHLQETVQLINRDLEPLEREFSYYQKDIARNRAQAEKHARNVAKLPELTARMAGTDASIEELRAKAAELKARIASLKEEGDSVDGRAGRATRLLDLPVDDLAHALRALRADEDGGQRRTETLLPGDDARCRLREVRDGLSQIEEVTRGFADLRKRIGEERAMLLEEEGRSRERRERLEADRRAYGKRRRRRNWAAAVLLVIGAVLVPWAVDHGVKRIRRGAVDFAAEYGIPAGTPAWVRASLPTAVPVCAALCLAGLVCLTVRGFRQSAEGGRLELAMQEVSASLDRSSSEAACLASLLGVDAVRDVSRLLADAEACGNPRVGSAARDVRQALGSLASPDRIAATASGLSGSYRALQTGLSASVTKLEREVSEIEGNRKRVQGDRSRLENEIRECQSQQAKQEALEEKNRELEASAASIRADIDVKRLACSLVEETVAGMRSRIGPSLTQLVKRALPRLTLDRYRDVRVESDLQIKVYSGEKNDFLSLHELSGGTNEALSLALRLAVSQALVGARTRRAQFVLLDEPFKMMDVERSLETLRVLRDLSPDLRQFIIVQPSLPEAAKRVFQAVVRTTRDASRLEVDCR